MKNHNRRRGLDFGSLLGEVRIKYPEMVVVDFLSRNEKATQAESCRFLTPFSKMQGST
jgi:hypothetical protein